MSRWRTEHLSLNKQYPLKTKEDLLDFVEFALAYSVDYVYILEVVKDVLEGKEKTWIPENFIDY